MIYTCTLNPAIDYFLQVDNFRAGELNHVKADRKMPGGKGINVSRVLKHLGQNSKCLGFIGGFTGEFIKGKLAEEGIEADFVPVDGDTRINVKLKSDTETEINGVAPQITDEQLNALFAKLKKLTADDILVLSGSAPATLPVTIYKDMMDHVSVSGAKVVVDTSGKAFREIVEAKPFLVKPNHHELGEYFGVTIENFDEVKTYGKKLVEKGIDHVIISMGGKGAIYIDKDQYLYAPPAKGELKNSVGAGDSLVGGFLSEYAVSGDFKKAFQKGAASGSATAFSVDLCTKEKVEELLPQIKISTI
ncbi:1-phosphofructokinase [Sporolactobacillus shoreicorticis]|uniref:Tagatose-6-phosphate kinase n=1 Tax=Sporolactobacillus shoreicorticis TaxID=1923877 RepID=A0ABW5S7X5_9BACL|nr:1-phosphofructokinase [Sporolactobacillus shoreicorticis]MCO7125504.1 1-phosphofructokinase [Sporolactobacillus shoreicorticis]